MDTKLLVGVLGIFSATGEGAKVEDAARLPLGVTGPGIALSTLAEPDVVEPGVAGVRWVSMVSSAVTAGADFLGVDVLRSRIDAMHAVS